MISYNNKKPLTYNELVKIENKIYKLLHISKKTPITTIDNKIILSRTLEIFKDKMYNMPENIFILTGKDMLPIVGRKIRSPLSFSKKINAINCSKITSSMLLGYLESHKQIKNDITVKYFPFTFEEKKSIFDKIIEDRNIDIYYPYNHILFETGQEEESSPNGWDFAPEKLIYLGYGEKHIREYTLKRFNSLFRQPIIAYDPACSTGQFLWEIKKKYPSVHTIGHDLSKSMIDYAQQYLDEALVVNAKDSPLKDSSVDIMFLRFLNVEVVSRKMAHVLFDILIKKVKPEGLIVCFGHTPLLIHKKYFLKKGLKILQANGFEKRSKSIFQYYILQKGLE